MRELNLQTEYANLKFAHLPHCSQALVAQLAEAIDLGSMQCEFESHPGHKVILIIEECPIGGGQSAYANATLAIESL